MQQKISQLDAVRGLAILLVIAHNTSTKYPLLHLQPFFGNGWMGVDLFFVLSGFLITGILVDTKYSEGYFSRFYARRCLRIWPLYYSLIFFMFVVVPWLRPSEAHTLFGRSSPWWAYPLFLQNFLVSSPTGATGPLGVTWSLAIEEQFYLVWPWVVRCCSRATNSAQGARSGSSSTITTRPIRLSRSRLRFFARTTRRQLRNDQLPDNLVPGRAA